jgi:hypothetical protein
MGVVLYLAAFAVLGGLALLPTYAQSLLGGWAFGFAGGLPVVLAGFAGAALVNYAIAARVRFIAETYVLGKRIHPQ